MPNKILHVQRYTVVQLDTRYKVVNGGKGWSLVTRLTSGFFALLESHVLHQHLEE